LTAASSLESHKIGSTTIILDSRTLINFHACRQMESIIASIAGRAVIAERVFDECRLDPFIPDDEVVERTDLLDLISAGSLTVVASLTDDELNTFAQFTIKLDDGEAMTLALAVHRGWTVVTDDRAAIRELSGHAPLLSTLDLVKAWADAHNVAPDILRDALEDLRARGKYVPARSHPHRAWWEQHLLFT
jgi:predicted nucleic acid-binding protein